ALALLHCDVARAHLHSFPTRRSSDLDLRKEGYSEGTVGNLQTFFLTGIKGPWNPEALAPLAPVDSLVVLAREMIVRKNYPGVDRSEEHTSELQSRGHLVCRLLLEKKK